MCAKIAMNPEDRKLLKIEDCKKVIRTIYTKLGMPPEDAEIVANVLTEADLRGVDTHGTSTTAIYANRLIHHSLNPKPRISIKKETPISALVDGDNGDGHVVGYRSMEIAIQKAKKAGVGIVSTYNSNHFGATAYYSMMAQKEGLIGISMTNTGVKMAPTGGITPTFGTNPWSIAFPNQEGEISMVIDMSCSVVAWTNVLMAREHGLKIPTDWALDAKGLPTDDPNAAVMVRTMGGYKGYAIALAVELLSGVMSGSALGKEIVPYNNLVKGQNLGHFFMAMDIEMFTDLKSFCGRWNEFTDRLHNCEKAEGCEKIYIPGEKEYISYGKNIENGITLDKKYVEQINAMCRELGLDVRL